MTKKRGPDEEKSYFEFLAFLVLYYINKACVKILWQYLKYFLRYGHFIYQPHYRPCFVFSWFFILFLGLQQCSIPHSQIYNFLIVWLRLLIFGMPIHQTIWNHCSWLFIYLWPWPLTPRSNYWLIWKYCILHITFFSLGLDFKFLACC